MTVVDGHGFITSSSTLKYVPLRALVPCLTTGCRLVGKLRWHWLYRPHLYEKKLSRVKGLSSFSDQFYENKTNPFAQANSARMLWLFKTAIVLACENSRFSSPLAAWDVSRGETSATQRQKFHTVDVNQCLHNNSSSHGVPNAHSFNFTFLLVDFGKVFSSANELRKNLNASSREEYNPQILTVLL